MLTSLSERFVRILLSRHGEGLTQIGSDGTDVSTGRSVSLRDPTVRRSRLIWSDDVQRIGNRRPLRLDRVARTSDRSYRSAKQHSLHVLLHAELRVRPTSFGDRYHQYGARTPRHSRRCHGSTGSERVAGTNTILSAATKCAQQLQARSEQVSSAVRHPVSRQPDELPA